MAAGSTMKAFCYGKVYSNMCVYVPTAFVDCRYYESQASNSASPPELGFAKAGGKFQLLHL